MNPISVHKHILSFLSSFLQAGDKAFYFFSALSQVEAALFGIIFTITLIMVQIINDKYGINATKIVVDHKIVKRFISLFLTAIFSSLGALVLTSSPFFAIIWPVGIIMGGIFIARIPKFLSDISNLVNIYSIADEIIKKMPHQMTDDEFISEQDNDSGWFRALLDLLTFTIEKKPVSVFHNILHKKIKPLFPIIVNNFPLARYLENFYLPLLVSSIETSNYGVFDSILLHLNALVDEIGAEPENDKDETQPESGKKKRSKGMEFSFFLINLKETLISQRADEYFLKSFIHIFLRRLPLPFAQKRISPSGETPSEIEKSKYNEVIAQRSLEIFINIIKDKRLNPKIRCEALQVLAEIYRMYDGWRFLDKEKDKKEAKKLRDTFETVRDFIQSYRINEDLKC